MFPAAILVGSEYLDVLVSERVMYRSSLKGYKQLILDDFPFTRHTVRGDTFYWRCVQSVPLNCKARVKTSLSGERVFVVNIDHNHGILKERRKKGSLKRMYEQRKLARGRKK